MLQKVAEKEDLTGATSWDNSDIVTKRRLSGFLDTTSVRSRNDDRVLRGLRAIIKIWMTGR